jgi:hypothetical protein
MMFVDVMLRWMMMMTVWFFCHFAPPASTSRAWFGVARTAFVPTGRLVAFLSTLVPQLQHSRHKRLDCEERISRMPFELTKLTVSRCISRSS